MSMKSAKQELQNVKDLMQKTVPSTLAKNIQSANLMIIKALYYANVDYSDTSSFINDYLNFYAPFHMKYTQEHHDLSKADVEQWQSTFNLIIDYAKNYMATSALAR